MKIAFFTDTFDEINGVSTSIRAFSRVLSERGHVVKIFAPSRKGTYRSKNVYYFRSVPIPVYSEYLLALAPKSGSGKIMDKFAPDVVHSHSPFVLGRAGASWAKKNKKPLVGTFHTLIPEFLPLYLGKTLGGVSKNIAWKYMLGYFEKCDKVVAPSHYLENLLRRKGLKKLVALSNGVDYSRFAGRQAINVKKKLGLPRGSKILLHVGRVSYEKRIIDALRSAKTVLKKHPEAFYLVLSDGPARQSLEKFVEKNALSENTAFTGFVPEKHLSSYFRQSYALLFPSVGETEGLTLKEAMYNGLPPVVAKSRAAVEAVSDGVDGLLFRPKKFRELAEKTLVLLEDEKLRNKMASEAKKKALRFSVDAQTKKLEKLYEQLIGNNNDSG